MSLDAAVESLKTEMKSQPENDTSNSQSQATHQQQQRAMNGSMSRIHRKSNISPTNPFHRDLNDQTNASPNSIKINSNQTNINKTNPFHPSNHETSSPKSISNHELSQQLIPNEDDIAHQKAENMKRQQLVETQLKEKAKRLQLEQQKLAQVNGELHALETKLAKDVAKLREMIDSISYDINWYEKDFEYKKKQYLDSLKNLQTLKERRTKLTEHLHTIISTNEKRKVRCNKFVICVLILFGFVH